ncbi:MAG: hypothetical protein CM15mV42_1450 [uncultured marine virus]|nr:MAG: hypothetical protein CM15mV42_1450 [uncultured marine virus]
MYKSELDKPSYDYKCDQENAWAFYNHVTHGLKKAHPRDWLSDSKNFHEFITADLLGNMGIVPNDTIDLSKYETMMDNTQIDIELEDAHVELVEPGVNSSVEHQINYLGA